MARLLIPVTWTQEVNGSTTTKTVYYLKADAGEDCAADETPLLTLFASILNNNALSVNQKVDQLAALFLPTIPANLAGMFWDDRDCSGTYIETSDDDIVGGNPANPGGGGDPVVLGGTVVDPPNDPTFLDIRYEWQQINGEWLARLYNQASPSASGGNQLMYFMDGDDDPFIGAMPNDYYVTPGTTLMPLLALGPRVEMYPDGYSRKSQQFIYIGAAPSS